MTQRGAGLGPLENDVMDVLWRAGRSLTVRKVAAELNTGRPSPLAYTTVMTVMSRLAGKGLLRRSRSGRRFEYEPVVADAADVAVRGVLDKFGDAALARFVERAELDPALRTRLRKLMLAEPAADPGQATRSEGPAGPAGLPDSGANR